MVNSNWMLEMVNNFKLLRTFVVIMIIIYNSNAARVIKCLKHPAAVDECIVQWCVFVMMQMSLQYQQYFLQPMVQYVCDKQGEVRQAAAYGIGIMAQFGGQSYLQAYTGTSAGLRLSVEHFFIFLHVELSPLLIWWISVMQLLHLDSFEGKDCLYSKWRWTYQLTAAVVHGETWKDAQNRCNDVNWDSIDSWHNDHLHCSSHLINCI